MADDEPDLEALVEAQVIATGLPPDVIHAAVTSELAARAATRAAEAAKKIVDAMEKRPPPHLVRGLAAE